MCSEITFNDNDIFTTGGYLEDKTFRAIPHSYLEQEFVQNVVWRRVCRTENLHSHDYLDPLTLTLCDPKYRFVHWDNTPYHMPELVDLFPDDEGRWLRLFCQPNAEGNNSKHQTERLLRLQILQLYTQVCGYEARRRNTC